jgi:hypothetical protein
MPIPTWSVGQVLSASDVNAWFVPLAVIKPTGQPVTSSTALVNDNDLVLPVAASASYLFECVVSFTATSGGDLKWTWAVPAGASLLYQSLHNEGGGTGLNNSAVSYSDANTVPAAGNGATVESVTMRGNLTLSSTAGNLQLRWAQNASNAGATTVRAQSHLSLQRVA